MVADHRAIVEASPVGVELPPGRVLLGPPCRQDADRAMHGAAHGAARRVQVASGGAIREHPHAAVSNDPQRVRLFDDRQDVCAARHGHGDMNACSGQRGHLLLEHVGCTGVVGEGLDRNSSVRAVSDQRFLVRLTVAIVRVDYRRRCVPHVIRPELADGIGHRIIRRDRAHEPRVVASVVEFCRGGPVRDLGISSTPAIVAVGKHAADRAGPMRTWDFCPPPIMFIRARAEGEPVDCESTTCTDMVLSHASSASAVLHGEQPRGTNRLPREPLPALSHQPRGAGRLGRAHVAHPLQDADVHFDGGSQDGKQRS
eukprot:6254172-Prymnesium_polylepis.1